MHDLVCEGGVIDCMQQRYLNLLFTWGKDGGTEWQLVEAVTRKPCSRATEDVRRYARRNLLIYSGGIFRVYEIVLSEPPAKFHGIGCTECSLSSADKSGIWKSVDDMQTCCRGFVGDRILKLFPSETSRSSALATEAVRSRERNLMKTTKQSEVSHGQCQRILSSLKKPTELSHFCCFAFLRRISGLHAAAGGDQQETERKFKRM